MERKHSVDGGLGEGVGFVVQPQLARIPGRLVKICSPTTLLMLTGHDRSISALLSPLVVENSSKEAVSFGECQRPSCRDPPGRGGLHSARKTVLENHGHFELLFLASTHSSSMAHFNAASSENISRSTQRGRLEARATIGRLTTSKTENSV